MHRLLRSKLFGPVVALALLMMAACGSSQADSSRPSPSVSSVKLGPPPAVGVASVSQAGLRSSMRDMGRRTILWNTTYMSLGDPVNVGLLNASVDLGVRHHIVTLEFNGYTLANIIDKDGAAHLIDKQLDRISGTLRKWQAAHPDSEVILRPLHEGNGNWYDWGFGPENGQPHKGNTKQQYLKAWWHLHGRMQASFPDLKFFWCPNRLLLGETSFEGWYPGDKNVDYVGDDAYNRLGGSQDAWTDPMAIRQSTMEAIHQVAPNKPYIVGETATRNPIPPAADGTPSPDGDHTKAEWYEQFGRWMRETAPTYHVVAVINFVFDKTNLNGNDWRIYPKGQPGARETRAAFREAIKGLP